MIIVLEDDPIVATMLDELIHDLDEACEITSSVDDAYRRIAEVGAHFSLALVDLRIEGDELGGIRLIERIRQIDDPSKSDLPVVVMSGAPDFSSRVAELTRLHIAGLLRKPFMLDDLDDVVRRYSRWSNRPMVLVVEDERVLARVYRRVLRRAGYESEWVETGQDALSFVSGMVPSLVLIDLHLPDSTGWELASRLRAAGITCPMVAVTGWDDRQDIEGTEFVELLTKPLGLDALVSAVARHVAGGDAK